VDGRGEAVAVSLVFHFGQFQLDPESRQFHKAGQPVHLPPKEFDILLYLLENSGRAVRREELLTNLWRGVVVEESNLTQNIFLLRKALGDTVIETVPRFGYRLAVPVEKREQRRLRWPRKSILLLALILWSILCYWLGHYFVP
jgi:DNA-binding winged helix-turn-helix (wHTH) protein